MTQNKQKKPALAEWEDASSDERAYFGRLCDRAVLEHSFLQEEGIGTLQEKRLHSVVKHFLCADEDCHEVGVSGTRYVSDVRVGNEVYEVQTGSFYPMAKKIAYYLEHTDCTVHIVHPVPWVRWLSWVDEDTLEVSPRKRVARTEKTADLLPEFYCLLPFLNHPRLYIRLLYVEVYDFRLGTKEHRRGSARYERIPLSLLGQRSFHGRDDFQSFLPEQLPQHFTVGEFSKLSGLRGRDAYSAVRVLAAMELVQQGENIGRSRGWRRVQ